MENEVSQLKKALTVVVFGLIGQALCWITIYVGFAITTEYNALILHAILAPVFFFIVSLIYTKKYNYTSPINTAIIFISIVFLMDFFIVALLIEQSFAMFLSPLGTWIPFSLNFIATTVAGTLVNKNILFSNKKTKLDSKTNLIKKS